MKRIYSVLIVITLLIGMLPTVAIPTAAESIYGDLTYQRENGEITITGCEKTVTGELVIPPEIGGYPVTTIGDYAFFYCSELTEITIPSSVTHIDDSAFYLCTALTSIKIPNSVKTIGANAFSDCAKLDTVTMGNGITSIGSKAFDKCPLLTRVEISDLAAWCEISFSDALSNPLSVAKNLYLNDSLQEELTIPNGVTTIKRYAFYGSNIRSVSVPSSVTTIEEAAFAECVALETAELPNSITQIDEDVFQNTALYNNAENWTEGVLYVGNYLIDAKETVSGAYSIKEGTRGIAPHAFYDCSGLTAVSVPSSMVFVGNRAFDDCTGLTRVDITDLAAWCALHFFDDLANPLNYARKLYINGALLTDLVVPDEVTYIGLRTFIQCSDIRSVVIGKNVKSIGQGAFYHCDNLTTLIVSDSVNEIGSLSFASTKLTTVTLGKGVKMIFGSAFRACNELTTVYYRNTFENRRDIRIGSNPSLMDATWYYESCIGTAVHTPPTGESYCDVCGSRLCPFTDVQPTDYFRTPVLWASRTNVTTGISATVFGPFEQCNRAQVATFLWRAAGSPEPTLATNPFTDVKPTDYYYKAVLWAVEKGITTGTSATTFSPFETCQRGQIVTFLYRYAGKPAASGTNPFTDVKPTDYYYDAVRWAAQTGITTGTSDTTFSPFDACNRAQVVTFLYRMQNPHLHFFD